jgi:hypothetical protein
MLQLSSRLTSGSTLFLAKNVVRQRQPEVGLGDVLMVPAERVNDLPVRILE